MKSNMIFKTYDMHTVRMYSKYDSNSASFIEICLIVSPIFMKQNYEMSLI